MTGNEAINELQANIDLPFGFTVSDEVSGMAIQALEEIQQYRAIGTIEEFKALKEKSVAKKANYDNEDGWERYVCPNCGKTVGEHQKYCWNCGQAFET